MSPTPRTAITFVVDQLAAGGAERHALDLVHGIDRSRFAPSFVTLKAGGNLSSLLREEGLAESACMGVSSGIQLAGLRRLASHFDRCRTAIAVATNPYATFYALAAGRMSASRPSVVSTFHSTLLPGLKNQAQMAFYRLAYRRCDVLVYVCENQRNYWRGRGLLARRDIAIHNGIDVARFTAGEDTEARLALRDSLGFHADDYVVGICAALRPEKAHGDLLAAISSVARRVPAVKCLVIGDGPERGAIESRIAALGLGPRVRITGFQMDVRPYIRTCDVMALPSRSETFSLAALESMALARPIVMTDTGGASEQVQPGEQGFLFAPGDVDALAQHLETLGDVAERARMGLNAARRVRESFTVEGMLGRYLTLYEEVARSRLPATP